MPHKRHNRSPFLSPVAVPKLSIVVMRRAFTALCCALFCVLSPSTQMSSAVAEIKLPCLFSDSMVLQRDQPVKVWGRAQPGSSVTVAIGDQKQIATTAADGQWNVTLTPLPAGGPYDLLVTGDNSEIRLEDVMIGEVWLCSGQSNMAMTVNGVADAETELSTANFPSIRMFTVRSEHATSPQEECSGSWAVCQPNSVAAFSATAYFFGRRLHQELDIPIGLINSSVGGTSIESWTSLEAQTAVTAIQPRLDAWKQEDAEFDAARAKAQYERQLAAWEIQKQAATDKGQRVPRRPQLASQPRADRNYPSNLFNGKIHPLIGYTIRGAIWYQGENSASRGFPQLYQVQLETLIADWRARWGQGDFPFAWVQLPNFREPQVAPSETSGWVLVQEGMRKSLRVPHTGMAVTVDIGEAGDIHPRNKQDVGSRLAQWALADVYGKKIVATGPLLKAFEIVGSRFVLTFDHCGSGLKCLGDEWKGFAIAGEDRKFVWAKAKLEGDKLVVWHDDIAAPQSVRYAWASNPVISLCNADGLPASPFRTDEWPETPPAQP